MYSQDIEKYFAIEKYAILITKKKKRGNNGTNIVAQPGKHRGIHTHTHTRAKKNKLQHSVTAILTLKQNFENKNETRNNSMDTLSDEPMRLHRR